MIKRQLARFSRLHYSDWYLNRSLFRLWLGIAYISEENCARSRDDAYYSIASYRILERWRRIAEKERVPTLEARGLAPKRPTRDQEILLSARDARSSRAICRLMRHLLPMYAARL